MKLATTFFVLQLVAATSFAQGPADDGAIGRVSHSADRQLETSIAELNLLRERIAAEKLPLAQELTRREEEITALRRDNERVARLVDSGALELTSLKTKIKLQEDELSYVGNLLDEYARSFDSKVHVSEMQSLAASIATAKLAAENTTLTQTERFAQQTSLVETSMKRLFDAIGGVRFTGTAVDLQGAVATGQFALLGPVALFKGPSDGATGLVIPQSGSSNPLIRPLEGPMQAGIALLVETGEGLLPLDPSRGGALKALIQKTNLFEIFEQGGPIMWPLLLASVLALGTVIERTIFLMRERMKRDRPALDQFFSAVASGDLENAARIAKTTQFFVVRALGYALEHREQSLESALLYAQSLEMKRFRRGIPILDTVITLAPLLGLLGTVTGMMSSFSLIGGELSAPGAITGGIAEALIATAFGLGIAILALLPFNWLNARMEDAEHELDSAAAQLELLIRGGGHMTPSPATSVHVPTTTSNTAASKPREPREVVKA